MEEKEAQITVVVVMHNAECYVERCLNSLTDQESQHFRIILVDDGSNDRSREICRAAMCRMKGAAQLLELPHSGVANARNRGLEQVKTPYVLFLDSDDWLERNTISNMIQLLERHQPELAVFGFYYELTNGSQHLLHSHVQRNLLTRESIEAQFVNLWNSGLMYSCCNKLFSVSMLRKHQITFQDLNFGEDLEFCKCVMRVCTRLVLSDQCFYHYTCHIRGSLSTRYREDLFELRREEHRRFEQYFRELGRLDERAEEYLSRRYIERLVGCVENECSPESTKTLRKRLCKIRQMLDDAYTAPCADRANLTSLRMKLLVIPIRWKWYRVTLLSGYVMSLCRNRLPVLFAWLKMNR
ncbi:PGL/p-HBAD biosynthesis glycosyltransferase Rv2957/MT3031 [uncultured Flavonifractor sp.]|nr:PGL/p-HBAD biosynthesis glycosyltransferase Rv2957/MT3031 [uncultured Flavonifractor sp.]